MKLFIKNVVAPCVYTVKHVTYCLSPFILDRPSWQHRFWLIAGQSQRAWWEYPCLSRGGDSRKFSYFFFGLGILIDIDDIMLELNGKNLRRPARRNSLKIFDLAPASSKNCIMSLF
jgi:hypothetical protein